MSSTEGSPLSGSLTGRRSSTMRRRQSSAADSNDSHADNSTGNFASSASGAFFVDVPNDDADAHAIISTKDVHHVGGRLHSPFLMINVVRDVTVVFAPVLQYERRRSSAVSTGSSPTTSRSGHVPFDPMLLVDMRPSTISLATSVLSHGGHENHKLAASTMKHDRLEVSQRQQQQQVMMLGSSANSDSLDEELNNDTTKSSTGYADFFDPPNRIDPFETDNFSPETRRKYQEDRSRDEELEALLAPYKQALLQRQAELTQQNQRTVFGSNIRFVTTASMWKTIACVLWYAHRVRSAWADMVVTQNIIRQMAPLCAIRLRQRLKKTRLRHYLETVNATPPSIQVFKADRTFSHFPEEQLEKLRERIQLQFFFRSEALWYRGVQGDTCYIIEHGVVDTRDGLSVISTNRKNHVIGALGMIVGEPRLHSVVASTEVYAWVIHHRDFEATLNVNDAKTKNAIAVVHELRQKNIRDVHFELLRPVTLRQYLLFAGIRDSVLENIMQEATPKVFKKGDTILRGGEQAYQAIMVIRGRVRLNIVPNMPLSKAKTVQQHVAEAVCLLQPKRRKSVASTAANDTTGGTAVKGLHRLDFVMRGDDVVGRTPPPKTPGEGSLSMTLTRTGVPLDGSGRLCLTPISPSGQYVAPAAEGMHNNGMACDIACPVLISLPSAVSAGTIGTSSATPQLHSGDAAAEDSLNTSSRHLPCHAFQVTVLSDSADTIVISADRLSQILHQDRQTWQTYCFNLTCLALPFIRPLPRLQLLHTLFPRSFAFDFLPKLSVQLIRQVPVVFANDDLLVMDGEPDACAVIVLKGTLHSNGSSSSSSSHSSHAVSGQQQHLDGDSSIVMGSSTSHVTAGSSTASQSAPYLWPDISFVCTAGAKASTRATSSIEGILVRRSDILDVIAHLRTKDREVLVDALKAHFCALVGRQAAISLLGGTGLAASSVDDSESAATRAAAIRIRSMMKNGGLQGSNGDTGANMSEVLDGEGADEFRRSKNRGNPLLRAEYQSTNKQPKRPDFITPMSEAVSERLRTKTEVLTGGVVGGSGAAGGGGGGGADYYPSSPSGSGNGGSGGCDHTTNSGQPPTASTSTTSTTATGLFAASAAAAAMIASVRKPLARRRTESSNVMATLEDMKYLAAEVVPKMEGTGCVATPTTKKANDALTPSLRTPTKSSTETSTMRVLEPTAGAAINAPMVLPPPMPDYVQSALQHAFLIEHEPPRPKQHQPLSRGHLPSHVPHPPTLAPQQSTPWVNVPAPGLLLQSPDRASAMRGERISARNAYINGDGCSPRDASSSGSSASAVSYPKSFLGPSLVQRRQVELLQRCSELKQEGAMVNINTPLTSPSTRMIRRELEQSVVDQERHQRLMANTKKQPRK